MRRQSLVVRKKDVNNWIDFILFFFMFVCMKCMLLGNVYPVFGLVCGAVCFIKAARRNSNKQLLLYIACCVFWGYCTVQGIAMGSNSRGYLIQTFVFWFIQAGVGFFLFSKREKEHFIISTLIRILALIAAGYLVSLVLGTVVGWSTIKIAELDYNYFYNAPIYLPFTIAYGSGHIGGFEFWRMLGIGRESGITQCLYAWAYFSADKYFADARKIKILLMIGVVTCLSTTGIVLFFSILIINQLTKNLKRVFSIQTVGIILVVTVAAVFLMSDSTFGLSFRLEKSFADRALAMSYGIDNLKQNPLFGVGFMRSTGSSVQSEINLIAALGNIGLVGGVLFLLVYIVGLLIAEDKRHYITANGSFFLTALIAQPLYVSPLMYLFLFTNYSKTVSHQTRRLKKI